MIFAKVQGQRSVGFEDRVQTNGRTNGADCIPATLVRSLIGIDLYTTSIQFVHRNRHNHAVIGFHDEGGIFPFTVGGS